MDFNNFSFSLLESFNSAVDADFPFSVPQRQLDHAFNVFFLIGR